MEIPRGPTQLCIPATSLLPRGYTREEICSWFQPQVCQTFLIRLASSRRRLRPMASAQRASSSGSSSTQSGDGGAVAARTVGTLYLYIISVCPSLHAILNVLLLYLWCHSACCVAVIVFLSRLISASLLLHESRKQGESTQGNKERQGGLDTTGWKDKDEDMLQNFVPLACVSHTAASVTLFPSCGEWDALVLQCDIAKNLL
jgi:hypothetical protein